MTMTESKAMAELIDGLHDAAVSGHPVSFWLRDDDAVDPSEPLDRLLALTKKYSVPVTLAVIPENTGSDLVDRLESTRNVSVAVHGWSHSNHASAAEKKQELGNHRPLIDILAELDRGFGKLSQLHHTRFVPLLVPPWNRISPEIVNKLEETGFRGLSTFGDEKSTGIQSIIIRNTHVDIIDWRGTRGGRPAVDLVAEIVAHVKQGRTSIGILSHHLVHDEAAWCFLQQLFATTSEHPGARWLSIDELLTSP